VRALEVGPGSQEDERDHKGEERDVEKKEGR